MSRRNKKDFRQLATTALSAGLKGCRRLSCPICSVVPPHILREIAKNGNPEQQDWAFQNLTLSARLRGQRDVMGNLTAVMASVGEKRRTIFDAKNGTDLPGTLVRGEAILQAAT
jgi:Zn-dependent metalloprotease